MVTKMYFGEFNFTMLPLPNILLHIQIRTYQRKGSCQRFFCFYGFSLNIYPLILMNMVKNGDYHTPNLC